MDRLSIVRWTVRGALVASGLLVIACQDSGQESAPLPSRVNAVKATKPAKLMPLDEFCDVHHDSGGPDVALPPVDQQTTLKPNSSQWINIWATWCKPCIEEMPLIRKWHHQMLQQGANVELVFVSIDEEGTVVDEFRKNHSGIPDGPRIANFEEFAPWLTGLGMDAGTSIPINIFTDANHKAKCIRTGALKSHHYDVIESLVGEKG